MRGEFCVGAASVLSFVSVLLLIFTHVGQINTSTVPRGISMVRVDVSGYGQGLAGALGDPIQGLYATNASAPLQQKAGLRDFYDFGLYSYCAYVSGGGGICSNHTTANEFRPYEVISADMLTNYSSLTAALIPVSTFTDSSYLGQLSHGAYYPILIGTICATLALILGLLKHTLAFLVSTLVAIMGSLMLLVGAAIWTAIIKKTESSINGLLVGPTASPVPLGITVSTGDALFLLWASCACLIISVLPYMISWRATAAVAALVALASNSQAVQNVSRSGRYLYNADGSRFFIKGVAYQPQGEVIADPNNPFGEPSTFIDPLANGTACSRDLPFLQQLQINAIRAYSVNSSLDHDDCMSALSNAGIYTIIDLSLPVNGSINRDQPAWTTNLLDLYIETINTFNKYDNVLAYNVGNEVINSTASTTVAAAYVKAAARDTRAYLNSIGSSALVGYAAIDGDTDNILAEYLSCDPSNSNSGSTSIDLYGLNNYEWCGNADPSVYSATNQKYQNYNVAAYFSEYGCVPSGGGPRPWTEVGTIFASPMSNIWSGGLAFSYFPASSSAGQFGMVNISADGSSVTTGQDFANLKSQYTQVSPPNSPAQSDAGSAQFPSCPAENATLLASTTLPPTPNDAACACLENVLSCRFTPTTDNTTAILGVLINDACSFLGAQGGSCDDISGNGTSGVYGRVSACDPSVELSYVMSEYYEATNRQETSCSFGGNGTVNANAPSGLSASAAASSCLSNPSATFTPSAPSGASNAPSSGSSGKGSSTNANAAAGFSINSQAVLGLAVSCAFSLLGGALVLA
ncbi:hypothetical protein OBBRIDRAFT_743565 [Obba rivulosa]|uniref:1,3-beta-glucanosyltransferase n=1 Tax=Obba rivulosa TaxID=1052685 RepID=A0A8E2DW01_9APHY|nr:hypothetical protein OBBRIDRAFT_743565 [Obba rivulosa]